MRKSFSLIELLIVVTIIAVLTGTALPFVEEYLRMSRISKAKNDLDEISRAINAFEASTGLFYTDTTGNVLRGRFLQKLPVDPWGKQYDFASATEDAGCTVRSYGPDKKVATEDDVIVQYKGPLAVVSARWIDVNEDGECSTYSIQYPASDTLMVRFNRKPDNTTTIVPGNWIIAPGEGVTASWTTMFDSNPTVSDRYIVWRFASNTQAAKITLASSTIRITTNIIDAAGYTGIPASVTILPR
ncbi:type II secretion system protein [Candidatus Riflebacteria bacterium]